ncbi:MAG TPA: molybdopterin cofactor-binding domain-containing protein, partial [Terriglobales bacterium]|nr:molybdopterin cofactor-binding domain-containing protein [Terriglobales bacterium]
MTTLTQESNRELISEREQHESVARFSYGFELHRRDFFKLLGGGMLVCACADPAMAQESGARHRDRDEEQLPQNISAWLHIAGDGKVTVYTGKVEVGQNIRTSLTQQVAEELRAPIESIQLIMGDTSLTPYDMGTFGSRTTPTMGPQLRNASAAARENLIDLAAQHWRADRSSLVAENGRITNTRSRQSVSYGELT